MTGRRFEGRNLDEALDSAAKTLGVEPFRISYHIVLQKRGFLGGTKRVVIEAEPRAATDESPEQHPPSPPSDSEVQPRMPSEPIPQRRNRRRPRRSDGRRELRGGDRWSRHETSEPAAVPPQPERSADEQRVAHWCEQVIGLMGLRGEVRTARGEGTILVTLHGPDARRLTERGGEAIDSIQVLVNKALTGRSIDDRIELDAGEFKRKREDEIARKARDLADVVRQERRERLLPAMSPIERRIVHLTLQDDEDVATESRGDGFLKRVAIVPRQDAPTTAPE